MSEVKNIPRLRFPEFEDHYSKYRLDQLLDLLTDFEANGSFASVKENVTVYDDHNFAWYVRATDLENNTDLDGVKYVDEHSYNFLKKTKLFGDELLITKRGEIGKVYYFHGQVKSTLAPNLYLLKLNSDVVSKYLFYFFKGLKGNKKLRRINASTTIGALYKDDVKSIKVDIPSLPEQQKIADFLTAVDKRIELLEKKKTFLETYKKGVMKKIFNQEIRFKDDNGNDFPDWEEKRLGDVSECLDNQRKPLNDSERQNMKGDIPYWGANNIMDYINEYIFNEPIVLLAEDGGNFNEFKDRPIANYYSKKCWVNNHTHVLKGRKDLLDTKFLFFSVVHKNIIGFVSGGTRSKLTKSEMLKIPLGLPCVMEQKKISEFLSSIEHQIELLENQIDKSKTWKKGLLQKMFV